MVAARSNCPCCSHARASRPALRCSRQDCATGTAPRRRLQPPAKMPLPATARSWGPYVWFRTKESITATPTRSNHDQQRRDAKQRAACRRGSYLHSWSQPSSTSTCASPASTARGPCGLWSVAPPQADNAAMKSMCRTQRWRWVIWPRGARRRRATAARSPWELFAVRMPKRAAIRER